MPSSRAMRVVISSVALLFLASSLAPAQSEAIATDEQTLTSFGLATDGQSLLDFFRARTRLETDREQLLELTRKLGDSAADARARAAKELIARGAVAIPALRHAVNDLSDPVIAQRARDCLRAIEGSTGAGVSAAAVRLLAARRPGGAAEVVRAYLPFADERFVADTV